MRIGLDGRLLGLEHAGIGRYVENLAEQLVRADSPHQFVFFLSTETQANWLSVLAKEVGKKVEVRLCPIRHYSWREQLSMPRYYRAANLDLLHVPHFNLPLLYRGRVILTIHDLLWHQRRGAQVTTLPVSLYWGKYLAYRFVTKQALQKAEAIIVPSASVRATLESYYPKQAEKVRVIYEGVSLPRARRPSFHLPRHYWLYVGSLYPHKNVERVLEAMREKGEAKLVVVSSRSVFSDRFLAQVASAGLTERVTFLERVTDQVLVWLYEQAEVLLQPSLAEGFGLTGVEAMRLGTPVVASDLPVFREIYGQGAEYFEPRRARSLLRAIARAKRRSPHARHQAQAWVRARYNWASMAQAILAVYEEK